jgi:hypothetical protein
MRTSIFSLTVLTLLTFRLYGQTRTIVGRVLSEDLETLPAVEIHILDTLLIGKTDFEGRFKIQIPQNTDKLIFSFLGMEWTTIQLDNACNTNEVVMMYDGTYDFMSPKKVDRLRLKRFKKLPELHLQAYKKGFFSEQTPCYKMIFESNKPYYDKIKQDRKKLDIQTKLTFEKLKIGDTVKIPYNGQFTHDGTDRTSLFVYSNWTDRASYDCVVQGTIISKNKTKKGFNLVYKVIDCNLCKSQSIYNGKTMRVGEIFEHNMRYFTILSE